MDPNASKKGKYGTGLLLRHHPDNTDIPFLPAKFKNSVEILVFPLPASPEINTVLPLPALADFRNSFSCSSSRSLPTRMGSGKILVCRPYTLNY
jgi:hypothetical protein